MRSERPRREAGDLPPAPASLSRPSGASSAAAATSTPDAPDEAVTVGRAADGDVRAFEVLVRRHSGLMRAYARSILGSNDEVDDVVQDAFIVAWQQLEMLDDPGAVKAWLMRIVSRRCIDRLRARREHDDLDDHLEELIDDSSPDAVVEEGSLESAVQSALHRLPLAQRRCWVLKEISGCSYREIATDLALPESTVRGLIARARVRLAREMEDWR